MNPKRKDGTPTLSDIARAAEVSVSAVSQILNNREVNFCSEEKKRRVREIAAAMNYRVNYGYRLLHGLNTNTVGIIRSTPRNSREEHIQLLHLRLMEKLEQQDNSVYAATMTEDAAVNLDKLKDLSCRGCSAFIFIGCPVGYGQLETFVRDHECNYISFGAPDLHRNVSVAPGPALEQYIDWLRAQNKNNFLIIGGHPCLKPGYTIQSLCAKCPDLTQETVMKRYYRQINRNYLFAEDFAGSFHDIGREMTAELLRADPGLNAIIYENDYLALGGVNAILAAGRHPGRDVLLRGYNNTNATRFFPYPVSTVDHDIENVSDVLIRELFSEHPVNLLLPPKLIIRT